MADSEPDDQLSKFLQTGIYRFGNPNVLFLDPVRILNKSYTRFSVSRSVYYSRFFSISLDSSTNKRKRCSKEKKKKQPPNLNSQEKIADQRHQEVRLEFLKAHESLLAATQLLDNLSNLRNEKECSGELISKETTELDFVELGSVWQAPLYEICLNVQEDGTVVENSGTHLYDQRLVTVFDNLVSNDTSNDLEAELLDHKYILPKRSYFYMSDLKKIHNLIPADSNYGFNLIVIDPPWENGSAQQKLKYQTLPNRHFLSLPVKQLTHTDGALVALWVTNREKLRSFVETELFPKWGVKHAKTLYWLKVKSDGSLISELDLFHHRPYECLLLGFCHKSETNQLESVMPDNQVIISIPGDYSRKPPIGELLLDYVPGSKPARCIELFSREMMAGWTSWGNEPLHFQDSRYFLSRTDGG